MTLRQNLINSFISIYKGFRATIQKVFKRQPSDGFWKSLYDILAQIDHLRQVSAKPCSSFYFEQDAFNDDGGEGEDIHFVRSRAVHVSRPHTARC